MNVPTALFSAEPLPSSPAQDALDLLFSCGSTEEASGSPARGPLTEAELALFDPFSKEGNKLGQSEGGLDRRSFGTGRLAEPLANLQCLFTSENSALCRQVAASVRMRSRRHSPAPGLGKPDAPIQGAATAEDGISHFPRGHLLPENALE